MFIQAAARLASSVVVELVELEDLRSGMLLAELGDESVGPSAKLLGVHAAECRGGGASVLRDTPLLIWLLRSQRLR